MIYGTLTLKPKWDTVIVTPAVAESFRHYPGTDITERFYQGRPATLIRCTLVIASEAEWLALRAVSHADVSAYLYMDYGTTVNGKYYADVTATIQDERELRHDGYWDVNIVFTACDPVPYLAATGARLY